MGVHRLLAGLALLVMLSASASAHILIPVERIGPGWSGDHYAWMSFVAFGPNGNVIASDGPADPHDTSNGLTFWTFPGGRLVKRLKGDSLELAPDWKYYAINGEIRRFRDDRTVYADASNKAGFVFSPDSRYVAVVSGEGSEDTIHVIALPDGKSVGAFGKSAPFGVAFSPNGKLLAVGHWDFVALWDVRTGKRVATLRGIGRYVSGLSFDAHGRKLAAGTDWGTVLIWDVHSRRRIAKFSVEGSDVSEPAFDPRGRFVAVGTYGSGTVWLADLRHGKIVDHRKVSDIGCGSVAFSPDGRYLITPSTGGLVTWPYDVGGTVRVFRVGRR